MVNIKPEYKFESENQERLYSEGVPHITGTAKQAQTFTLKVGTSVFIEVKLFFDFAVISYIKESQDPKEKATKEHFLLNWNSQLLSKLSWTDYDLLDNIVKDLVPVSKDYNPYIYNKNKARTEVTELLNSKEFIPVYSLLDTLEKTARTQEPKNLEEYRNFLKSCMTAWHNNTKINMNQYQYKKLLETGKVPNYQVRYVARGFMDIMNLLDKKGLLDPDDPSNLPPTDPARLKQIYDNVTTSSDNFKVPTGKRPAIIDPNQGR